MTRGIVTPSPKSNMQAGTFVEFLHRHRSLEFAYLQYYLGFSFLREFVITKPPCGIVRRAGLACGNPVRCCVDASGSVCATGPAKHCDRNRPLQCHFVPPPRATLSLAFTVSRRAPGIITPRSFHRDSRDRHLLMKDTVRNCVRFRT